MRQDIKECIEGLKKICSEFVTQTPVLSNTTQNRVEDAGGIFEIAEQSIENKKREYARRQLVQSQIEEMKRQHSYHAFFHGSDPNFRVEYEKRDRNNTPFYNAIFKYNDDGEITSYIDGTPLLSAVCDMILERSNETR